MLAVLVSLRETTAFLLFFALCARNGSSQSCIWGGSFWHNLGSILEVLVGIWGSFGGLGVVWGGPRVVWGCFVGSGLALGPPRKEPFGRRTLGFPVEVAQHTFKGF